MPDEDRDGTLFYDTADYQGPRYNDEAPWPAVEAVPEAGPDDLRTAWRRVATEVRRARDEAARLADVLTTVTAAITHVLTVMEEGDDDAGL